MKPAIRVENLSKQYHIGMKARPGSHNLTELIVEGTSALWRGLTNRTRGGDGADTFWALKDVSFEVQPGEVVGIIGRNGAGKSTLLKILSQIAEPTSGRAVVRGRMASLLEVGTGFHPELTGRENVYLNGSILGMNRQEINRKFDEIAAFAEINQFLDTPVKRYSSGMYVRLAFAVAAHLEPDILVLDEVLAVGDSAFQKKCLGKMQDVAYQGRTVLLVSHNIQSIKWLCQRSVLLIKGRIAEDGSTEVVLGNYLRDAPESATGSFDLRDHCARPVGCRPVLARLVLSARDGAPTTRFTPDDQLDVEVTIQLESVVRSPRMAVAIEDSMGRRITTYASYFGSVALPEMAGTAVVRCRVPRLGLAPGRYLLSVSIDARTVGLDNLHNAAWFEVEWNNNYGNGEPYNPIYGPVLANSIWAKIE